MLVYEGIKSGFIDDVDLGIIADNIIKNTYRTLMTRGMKGCYVYCANDELKEYFKKNLK